jgi:hypothetical protein
MSKMLKLKKNLHRLKFESITDKDLFYTEGKESEMLEKLAVKSGRSKEEMLGLLIYYQLI